MMLIFILKQFQMGSPSKFLCSLAFHNVKVVEISFWSLMQIFNGRY